MDIQIRKDARWAVACPTSMGVRITPTDRMAVHNSDMFYMQATSSETNVLNVASSLGMECLALTRFVAGSPVAAFIKAQLRKRNIRYEGKEVPQDGPWGWRHQFNIADSGFGLRAVRVWNDRSGEVFARWNETELDSYLIGITADILAYRDEDGSPLAEKILDTAGQKGTGKWTCVSALEEGVPLTLIGEAVFSRCLSAMKEERVRAADTFRRERPVFSGDRESFIESIRRALYASKIVSYAQGYMLMSAAAKTYGWDLDFGGIALMWRGGCIIRSVFLGRIKDAYDRDPELANLLLDPYFKETMESLLPAWREAAAAAVLYGVPAPALGSALSWFDGYTTERLPANLLQAQRDYFGAHTYERLDSPRGRFFHTNWTGRGGSTGAGTYNA